MNIKTIVVGPLQTNCYIIEKGDYCLIIDPGAEEDKIIENITRKVAGIVTTHGHDDHVGAINPLIMKYGARLYNMNNMPEGSFTIENFTFKVIYTPGHMNDEITLYFEEDKILFVGDFIFKGSIGRMDLPGGSTFDMRLSIKKILEYPKDITLYPGHYGVTTLENEVPTLGYYLNII